MEESHETPDIKIARKVYDECFLSSVGTDHRCSNNAEKKHIKHHLQAVYTRFASCNSCSCSCNVLFRFYTRLAPISRWLPKYSVKEDLVADLTGGLTVGIMHVPLGKDV